MRIQAKGAGAGVFLFLVFFLILGFLFVPLDVVIYSLQYYFNRSLGDLLSDPGIIIAVGGIIIIAFVLMLLFSFDTGFKRGGIL